VLFFVLIFHDRFVGLLLSMKIYPFLLYIFSGFFLLKLQSDVSFTQMGGIDEAALDRLSLVTQMTKHIRVRASGEKTSASEIGQFSPIFVWLLRVGYEPLQILEDSRKSHDIVV
jgi:hypothetical protein